MVYLPLYDSPPPLLSTVIEELGDIFWAIRKSIQNSGQFQLCMYVAIHLRVDSLNDQVNYWRIAYKWLYVATYVLSKNVIRYTYDSFTNLVTFIPIFSYGGTTKTT